MAGSITNISHLWMTASTVRALSMTFQEHFLLISSLFMPLLLPFKSHILHTPAKHNHNNSSIFNKMFSNSLSPPTHESPLVSLLETCKSMHQLKQIHSQTIQNKLIAFFCNEKVDMNCACKVFEKIPQPSVFLWNTMIKGYSRIHCHQNGVLMYLDMLKSYVRPDNYTFPFLLKGFTRDVAVEFGKELHCHTVKFGFDSSVFVQNALIIMYCLCGEVDVARGIFDMSCKDDVVTWNAMFSGYNRMKQYDETRKLFGEMERKGVLPTSVTIVLVLSACAKLKDLDVGKRAHRYVKECKIESNLILENALTDMYAACGDMVVALEIFGNMKNKELINDSNIN